MGSQRETSSIERKVRWRVDSRLFHLLRRMPMPMRTTRMTDRPCLKMARRWVESAAVFLSRQKASLEGECQIYQAWVGGRRGTQLVRAVMVAPVAAARVFAANGCI